MTMGGKEYSKLIGTRTWRTVTDAKAGIATSSVVHSGW